MGEGRWRWADAVNAASCDAKFGFLVAPPPSPVTRRSIWDFFHEVGDGVSIRRRKDGEISSASGIRDLAGKLAFWRARLMIKEGRAVYVQAVMTSVKQPSPDVLMCV
jgi:hypothetical protein